ncbi:hypothetical protein ACHAPQ_005477 [Fusarium lateritium]
MSSFTPINRPVKQKTGSAANENNPNTTAVASRNNDNNSSSNSNRSSTSTSSMSTNSLPLKPWQLWALQNGRTPLPETPGERPWLDPRASSQITGSQSSDVASAMNVLSFSSGTTNAGEDSSSTEATPLTYRFWSDDDMRSLISLRNGGATWSVVYAAFPERTPEAIKQAYHKRRHAVEREMMMEAGASNSQSNGNAGTNK